MKQPRIKCRKARAPKAKVVSLFPCPFCGSLGYVGLWSMSTYWSIGCTRRLKQDCPVDFPNRFETKDAAISFWNTRYQP